MLDSSPVVELTSELMTVLLYTKLLAELELSGLDRLLLRLSSDNVRGDIDSPSSLELIVV